MCVITVRFIVEEAVVPFQERNTDSGAFIFFLRRQASKFSNSNKRTLGIGKEY